MIGQKLRTFRKSRGLFLRQVAAALDVDTAYVSKMEKNQRPVSRNYLSKLARLYEIPEKELLSLWLASKVYNIVKNEDVAVIAMEIAGTELKNKIKTN